MNEPLTQEDIRQKLIEHGLLISQHMRQLKIYQIRLMNYKIM